MDLLSSGINAVVVAIVGLLLGWFGKGQFEAVDRRFQDIDRRFDGNDRQHAAIDEQSIGWRSGSNSGWMRFRDRSTPCVQT